MSHTPKDFAAELQEFSEKQWFDAHPAAAPTPHSDSLDPKLEICEKCGKTYDLHLNNFNVPWPCWTPSGRYAESPKPRKSDAHSDSLDKLTDLVEEVADAIKANRSMGVGEESIDTLLRERFRDRLFDALLSDVPLSPIAPELQSRIRKERESVRDAIRAHSDSLDLAKIWERVEALAGCGCRGCEDLHLRPLLADIPALLFRLEAAERERDEWVDREAKVCPEDFSFEEVIAALRSENARMADYLKFMANMMEVEGFTETAASINGFLARRAASPDANREEK